MPSNAVLCVCKERVSVPAPSWLYGVIPHTLQLWDHVMGGGGMCCNSLINNAFPIQSVKNLPSPTSMGATANMNIMIAVYQYHE